MLPATPKSELANEVRKQIGAIKGPDQGVTKVIERGGKPITAGLIKKNPFPREICDFEEPRCIVGAGCSARGTCYQIRCTKCQGDEGDQGVWRNHYICQSGASVHRRMLSHISKKDSVIRKHQQECHQGDKELKEMEMKVIKGTKGVLERLVFEGQLILKAEKEAPGSLMNGNGEYSIKK